MRIPKSIRWFVLGAIARYAARLAASRSVDRATQDLQQVLPPSASKVVSVLPDSVVRAGGAAVATGKATRRAATTTKSAKHLASNQAQKVRSVVGRTRSVVAAGKGAIAAESSEQRRSFTSELALQLRGQQAADEALLDLRSTSSEPSSFEDRLAELPTAADAVPPGRPRRLLTRPEAVARVQRLYQAPIRPWDRPTRRS